jgi:two-component system nitrogen regulation sensor histidine kinase GlnL
VLVVDKTLTVIYLNPAAENLLHISARQASGQPLSQLFLPAEEIASLCERVLETSLTFSCRELEVIVASQEITVDCSAAPLEGHTELVLLEFFDAGGRVRIRGEEELVALQDLSRRIVRQLAHEIKNPLGGLRGAAQLLDRQLSDPKAQAYTSVIIGEADRLAALVDSVLNPSEAPRPSEMNIHEVTEHVAALIQSEGPTDVAISRDYDPSLPTLWADRNQLIQAYLNLARNAVDALEGHGGCLVFRTRALTNLPIAGQRHGLAVSAEVEDDGPGIPEALQATVFYPLVTGGTTGTGIGLTVAQELAGRHEGLIEFESRPGKTVFKMRLPLKPVGGSNS